MKTALCGFFVAAYAVLVCTGKLYVRSGGAGAANAKDLVDGEPFCTAPYGNDGISIVCEPTVSADKVRFTVSKGSVAVHTRTEGVAPYAIAGDWNGFFQKWTPPTGSVSVVCDALNPEGSVIETITVSTTFTCDTQPTAPDTLPTVTPTPSATPSPASTTTSTTTNVQNQASVYMVVVEANKPAPLRRSDPLVDGFVFCITDFAPAIALECVAPAGTTRASIFVNGALFKNEFAAPFTAPGDNNGIATPWSPPSGQVKIKCETPNGNSDEVTGQFTCGNASTDSGTDSNNSGGSAGDTSPVGVDPKYCITMPAQSHTNPRPAAWTEDGSALVSWASDSRPDVIYPPETAVLEYTFTVPVESRYAISMDSETFDVTEHNDGWCGIAGQPLLVEGFDKDDRTKRSSLFRTGLQKAYQNAAKRFKGMFTVDFNGHSFSTFNKLKPGVVYKLRFGGRSTQFKLHGVMLFPCDDIQCWHYNGHFQRYLKLCNV